MQIQLTACIHRHQDCILIDAPAATNAQLKKIGCVKYSKTLKGWYSPLCRENFVAICKALQPLGTIDIEAIKTYLQNPSLHREQRKWIVDYVCGYSKANCGERMASAIIDFAGRRN